MNNTWVTIFPNAENVHLIKDVGYIPYVMHKKFGYNSYIACYDTKGLNHLDTTVAGLKVSRIKKFTNNSFIDGLIYIILNARKIDILHFFHFRKGALLWVLFYKLFNRRGKVYIKLDANEEIKKYKLKQKKFPNIIINFILKKCSLISVETKDLCQWLNENWLVDVKYIPNGFIQKIKRKVSINEKENIICTVGRIGAKEKANELLIEAFVNIHNKIPNWKLNFIGEATEEFQDYAKKLIETDNELADKIIFSGYIDDVNKLNEKYKNAKVFCMTSLYESFGLVFVDALKNGCYIITSNVLSAKDITNNEVYGRVFPINNLAALESLLVETCNNEHMLEELCSKIQDYAYENFDWDILCENIYNYLNENKHLH